MSESAAEATNADSARPVGKSAKAKGVEPKQGLFGRIALFVRQVIAEMKKVVTPTRGELISYTGVVIAFVAVVMAFIAVVDFVVGKGTLWLFG